MKIIFTITTFILLCTCSCKKKCDAINSNNAAKANLLVCSSANDDYFTSSWQLTNSSNKIIQISDNDSVGNYVNVDTSNMQIKFNAMSKYTGAGTISLHFDTLINLKAGSINTLFTAQNYFANNPNIITTIPIIINESDLTAPPIGFAKIRLIMAEQLALGAYGKRCFPYLSTIKFFNQNDTIVFNSRDYLDHVANPIFTKFINVPVGEYTTTISSPYGIAPVYTLESGHKYTILVRDRVEGKYGNAIFTKLIKHNF